VALAVALANHPALLLADEPTGALDRHSAGQMMDLLHALRRRYDLTVLIATHDLAVASHADRVLTLRDGALGQELSGSSEEPTALDESGKIRLPQAARAQLAHTPRIAVEIRPEGVLLRSEKDILDDSAAALHDILPPDAPPQQPERHWRRLWRRIRRADRVPRP
jgi:ABC-type multidrug transport system ATPase subunit